MGLNHASDQTLRVCVVLRATVQRDEWVLVECYCAMKDTFGDFFPGKIQQYWVSTTQLGVKMRRLRYEGDLWRFSRGKIKQYWVINGHYHPARSKDA